MIVTKEFIWYEDHFVCHITEEKNMLGIMEKGLIPQTGERCQYAMDKRKGVFCLDGIHHVEDWARKLYEEYELETLRLLRFNLKRRKWYLDNSNDSALGMYLPRKVLPEKISFLDIRNINGEELSFTKLFDIDLLYNVDSSFNGLENEKQVSVDDCSLCWHPIEEYKKIKKL